ncbi:TfpX/TfpZ family type IV pilin accessory protein [Rhodoferax mekongensis]|uniref:TfpX/TfpZ family type IV pilin accessory protein n=1 Tax=Rhodoferax mekongensis TaxID=3068341 RepID=UPI0028BED1F1|nr:TfpX/TfpZ family type IV pilin accessory protein [Rhodoferax sp. TBRC 17199]MDT7513578.1 TfpX/TfpZ family type IV pilin accessory protein [Rhodoferax sp. TBRC 17199]
MFSYWYPYPHREVSGGRELFLIMVSVDVIIGPLMTLIIYDSRKSLRVLRYDIAVIVLLQIVALGYGLWTMSMARPVHLVFEIDRFRVVHAIDVPPELLDQTRPGIVALPYRGPTVLGLRPFKDDLEKMHATLAALQGLQLSYRPEFWQSYDASRNDVLRIAKPIEQLKARFPDSVKQIEAATAGKAEAARTILYVPFSGRKDFWTVLIDGRNGDILGYLPLDSF